MQVKGSQYDSKSEGSDFEVPLLKLEREREKEKRDCMTTSGLYDAWEMKTWQCVAAFFTANKWVET